MFSPHKLDPIKIFYPKNKQDIIEIIRIVKNEKKTVHAYGSLHSNINIIEADYLINTEKLKKILSIDMQKKQVTVESGIKLSELNIFLEKEGLALENMGETTAPSIGGVISTATHGTGHTGTMSSFIIELELITSDEKSIILSKESNPEEFGAARVNLGCLGIIYSITLQCVSFYNLKHTRAISNWKEVKNNYMQLNKTNDHFMFFLNPYTKKTINYIWNKTEKKKTKLYSNLSFIFDRLFFGFGIQKFWKKLLEKFPSFIPKFVDIFFNLSKRHNIIDSNYKLLAEFSKPNHNNKTYNEQEIAIPIENFFEATQEILDMIEKYKKNNFFIWVILFRFVKADHDIYLSPSIDRNSVYISIANSHNNNSEFHYEFESRMLKFNGRPHWGKINFLNHEIASKLYGENLNKFIIVRKKLDPENLFVNSFVKKVLTKN